MFLFSFRLKLRNFWSDETRLPNTTLERMVEILRAMYSPNTETQVLNIIKTRPFLVTIKRHSWHFRESPVAFFIRIYLQLSYQESSLCGIADLMVRAKISRRLQEILAPTVLDGSRDFPRCSILSVPVEISLTISFCAILIVAECFILR